MCLKASNKLLELEILVVNGIVCFIVIFVWAISHEHELIMECNSKWSKSSGKIGQIFKNVFNLMSN